jgi:hypothetical protein
MPRPRCTATRCFLCLKSLTQRICTSTMRCPHHYSICAQLHRKYMESDYVWTLHSTDIAVTQLTSLLCGRRATKKRLSRSLLCLHQLEYQLESRFPRQVDTMRPENTFVSPEFFPTPRGVFLPHSVAKRMKREWRCRIFCTSRFTALFAQSDCTADRILSNDF